MSTFRARHRHCCIRYSILILTFVWYKKAYPRTTINLLQVERRRLKAVAGELERAFEEVRAKTDESIERQREAEAMKMEALAASKTAAEEREEAQLRSVRTEEAARRLEAERSSIAQASHNLQSCAE